MREIFQVDAGHDVSLPAFFVDKRSDAFPDFADARSIGSEDQFLAHDSVSHELAQIIVPASHDPHFGQDVGR
ncbi:hypothetical protein CA850_02760 [Micromonospora echinospora]|nr:hypothetical protein CA850_02760 [Micromonospora echinospora]